MNGSLRRHKNTLEALFEGYGFSVNNSYNKCIYEDFCSEVLLQCINLISTFIIMGPAPSGRKNQRYIQEHAMFYSLCTSPGPDSVTRNEVEIIITSDHSYQD